MALSRIDTTNMIEDVPQSKLDNNINFRNIIINGDMSIAQRGTSTSGVTSSDGYYACDRWYSQTDIGTWTISQSTDVPTGQGFFNSFKMNCTSAGTSNADEVMIRSKHEGQNLQYLKYGTSSAESLTLSFWIKSNKTGNYYVAIANANTTQDRVVSFGYTIDSANTWEKKTIVIPGDTSQNFDNNNVENLTIYWLFSAASGFTSGGVSNTWINYSASRFANSNLAGLGGSTSDEVYMTGVQLEAGQTASEFEFLPVDVNLQRCQRYFIREYESVSGDYHCYPGKGQSSDTIRFNFFMSCILRASPSISQSGGGWRVFSDSGASDSSSTATVLYYKLNTSTIALSVAGFSGLTDNEIYNIAVRSMTSFDLDAEL